MTAEQAPKPNPKTVDQLALSDAHGRSGELLFVAANPVINTLNDLVEDFPGILEFALVTSEYEELRKSTMEALKKLKTGVSAVEQQVVLLLANNSELPHHQTIQPTEKEIDDDFDQTWDFGGDAVSGDPWMTA